MPFRSAVSISISATCALVASAFSSTSAATSFRLTSQLIASFGQSEAVATSVAVETVKMCIRDRT